MLMVNEKNPITLDEVTGKGSGEPQNSLNINFRNLKHARNEYKCPFGSM
jgi:hypothetical protein